MSAASTQHSHSEGRPKVLIAGGGLGGLTMGLLLHKAGIPFEIYERATDIKPLGSSMFLNSTTASLFKQCGIYDEFVAIGKYASNILMCTEERKVDFTMEFAQHEKEFGAKGYMVTRPQFYGLLQRHMPKEHVHTGKKIVGMDQNDEGVVLRFSDGTEARGDILIGADGAYSAVRTGLYAKLKEAKKLPPSDALPLPFSTICLVGQTLPITTKEFPDLKQPECLFRRIIGTDKMYSWSTYTTSESTIAYFVIRFLENETNKEDQAFTNSDWGPEAAMAMCEEVKDFPVMGGDGKDLTLGDLFAWSSKEYISKASLEEKVFETWYDGRTVLLGDACHKFSPSGGVGATNAMHDAIVLANYLNGLPLNPTAKNIEAVFKEYKNERISWVNTAFESSKVFRTMVGQSLKSKIIRQFFKHIPGFVMRKVESRQFQYRPQVAFLPPVEDTGAFPRAHQPSLYIKGPQARTQTDGLSEQPVTAV
ncbi:MAG: hypothetical protein JOS17DRAFT_779223 [Linnemannia elongata]|nr:MAG: hypothetical protein JOS17DRAFT_779223 [Linnemannia elongata]